MPVLWGDNGLRSHQEVLERTVSSIPTDLRQRRQWVVWRREQQADGRWTKVPYRSTSPRAHASTTNSATWSSYETALRSKNDHRLNVDGLGFVFTDDDPFCGVDFDNVINESGEFLDSAWEEIQELNTYTEYSPSRKGVHAIGMANLPGRGRKTETSPLGGGLEVYAQGRFFCVTGWHVPDTPAKIRPFSAQRVVRLIEQAEGGSSESGKQKLALGKEISSRHDRLVHHITELWRSGMPYEQCLEVAYSIARDIELPKREHDEVARIVKYFYDARSLDNRVNREIEQLEVKHQAKRLWEAKRSLGDASLDDVLNGQELMELPDPEQLYVIDPIWPSMANLLIVAEKKTGKTTMMINLIRSLLDGEPFLGAMPVTERVHKRVLFMNYEMVIDTIKNWIKKQGIRNIDGLLFWQLKGKRVRLWDEEVARALAAFCLEQDVWCIVIDTQILSMRGLVQNENDAMEVADFQGALDQLKEISGVESIVLLHHTNRQKEARGSSRIEDWPDCIWYLQKEPDKSRTLNVEMVRYFDSRDTIPDNLVLSWDAENDRLSWFGASRIETKKEDDRNEALKALQFFKAANDRGPTKSEFVHGKKVVSGDAAKKTKLLKALEQQGLVRSVEVERAPGQSGRPAQRIELTTEGERIAAL